MVFKVWMYADASVTSAVADVRLYSWGLPLAVALVVASAPRRTAQRMGVVFGTVVLVVAWGMGFHVLLQFLRDAPEILRPMSDLKANLIAFGYQMGSLIVPGLAPCVVAIVLCRRELGPLLVSDRAAITLPQQ